VAATGSEYAPRLAFERAASAIASARRAVLAERYASNAFAIEWRELGGLDPMAEEWRDLAARALEPNVFYEPAFALAAAPVFGRGAGAVLIWSGTKPRKLLGFFPARIVRRRYGLKLPVLAGWTHPYAPLGTPLVDHEAAEPVIAAWLAHLSENPSLPRLLLLPLVAEDGPFAALLNAILRRAQMPAADFARHRRALLEPRDYRLDYVAFALSMHRLRELRRNGRRLADLGALRFTTATEPSAVAGAIEDFFALEASGWKGTAGTAASHRNDVCGFMKSAVCKLAARGKAAVDRIFVGGRVIAAGITFRSAGTAWYWKTAYDETFARYAPGVLLTMALTERLAEDETIARTDSCAAPDNRIMNEFWRERLTLCDRLIALRPDAPFSSARRLETLRGGVIAGVKTIRKRLLHHR